jgi:hypothetical protein
VRSGRSGAMAEAGSGTAPSSPAASSAADLDALRRGQKAGGG